MKTIVIYQTEEGREPFTEWIDSLTKPIRAKIMAYVLRLRAGGTKRNVKALGDGVFEVRVHAGSGYRVYFGEVDNTIIVLLVGGDKGSQDRDIKKAKSFWRSYDA